MHSFDDIRRFFFNFFQFIFGSYFFQLTFDLYSYVNGHFGLYEIVVLIHHLYITQLLLKKY